MKLTEHLFVLIRWNDLPVFKCINKVLCQLVKQIKISFLFVLFVQLVTNALCQVQNVQFVSFLDILHFNNNINKLHLTYHMFITLVVLT